MEEQRPTAAEWELYGGSMRAMLENVPVWKLPTPDMMPPTTYAPVPDRIMRQIQDMPEARQYITQLWHLNNESEYIAQRALEWGDDLYARLMAVRDVWPRAVVDFADANKQISELQQRVNEDRVKMAELGLQLQTARERLDESDNDLQRRLDARDTFNAELTRNNAILSEDIKRIEQVNENLKSLLHESQTKLKAALDELSVLRTEEQIRGTRDQAYNDAIQRNVALRDDVEKMRLKNDQLALELSSEKSRATGLEKGIDRLRDQLRVAASASKSEDEVAGKRDLNRAMFGRISRLVSDWSLVQKLSVDKLAFIGDGSDVTSSFGQAQVNMGEIVRWLAAQAPRLLNGSTEALSVYAGELQILVPETDYMQLRGELAAMDKRVVAAEATASAMQAQVGQLQQQSGGDVAPFHRGGREPSPPFTTAGLLGNEVESLRRDKNNLENAKAQLLGELTACKAAGDQAANDLAAMRIRVDDLARQLAHAKQDGQTYGQAEVMRLTTLNSSLSSDKSRLESDVLTRDREIASLKTQVDSMQMKLNEVDRRLTQASNGRKEVESHMSEVAALNKVKDAELLRLTNELASASDAMARKNNELKVIGEQLRDLRLDHADVLAKLKQQEVVCDQFKAAAAAHKEAADQSDADLKAERTRVAGLVLRAETAAKEIKRLDRIRQELETRSQKLGDNLFNERSEKDKLAAQIASHVESYTAADTYAKQQIDELTHSLSIAREEVADLTSEVNASKKIAQRLLETSSELEECRRANATLRDEAAALSADVARLQNSNAELTRQVSDLRSEMARIASLPTGEEQSKAVALEYQTQLDELQGKLDAASQENSVLNEKIGQLVKTRVDMQEYLAMTEKANKWQAYADRADAAYNVASTAYIEGIREWRAAYASLAKAYTEVQAQRNRLAKAAHLTSSAIVKPAIAESPDSNPAYVGSLASWSEAHAYTRAKKESDAKDRRAIAAIGDGGEQSTPPNGSMTTVPSAAADFAEPVVAPAVDDDDGMAALPFASESVQQSESALPSAPIEPGDVYEEPVDFGYENEAAAVAPVAVTKNAAPSGRSSKAKNVPDTMGDEDAKNKARAKRAPKNVLGTIGGEEGTAITGAKQRIAQGKNVRNAKRSTKLNTARTRGADDEGWEDADDLPLVAALLPPSSRGRGRGREVSRGMGERRSPNYGGIGSQPRAVSVGSVDLDL